MTLVVVVVPTLNNKAGGYEALQSIRSAFDIWWQPIIIDNWREPRSIAASWNFGVDQAIQMSADYVLIINDDVLFSPWTLTGLVRAFESSLKPSNTVMVTGTNMRGSMEPEDIFRIEIPSYKEHEFGLNPDFSCFMIKPETFAKVGSFDENFKPAYFEDNDYHYRIKLCGFEAISSSWAPFYHYGSLTQNYDQNSPTVPPEQFLKNQDYFNRKWGALGPGMETFQRPFNDPNLPASRWTLSK